MPGGEIDWAEYMQPEEYDDADCWHQDDEEIQQWIAAGCPWPIPVETREAIERRHQWLQEIWNGNTETQ